jgi:hypothetical protein
MHQKIVRFFSLLMFGVLLAGCGPKQHVGSWIVQDQARAFVFNENGTFQVLKFFYNNLPANQAFGGPVLPPPAPGTGTWRLVSQGRYTVNYSQNPVLIDFSGNDGEGRAIREHGFMRFVDGNTMFMYVGNACPPVLDPRSGAMRLLRANPLQPGR